MAEIPEGGFTNKEQLKNWLDSLPEEKMVPFARVLASRAALRALPNAIDYEAKSTNETQIDLTLQTLRANSIARVAGKHPTRAIDTLVASAARFATYPATLSADSAALSASYAARSAYLTARSAELAANSAARAAASTDSATLSANSAARSAVWNAVTFDARHLELGNDVAALSAERFWPNGITSPISLDREAFLKRDSSFAIWLDWYEPIAAGRPAFDLPRDIADALEERIALGEWRGEGSRDFWDRPVAEINSEIAGWVEAARAEVTARDTSNGLTIDNFMPTVPEAGPGPQYAVKGNQLSIVNNPPLGEELSAQTPLHGLLAKLANDFAAQCQRISNRHPTLANAAGEYALLLQEPIEAVNVTAVWSVGGSLAAYSKCFA